MRAAPLLTALRPHQWTKNAFVLAALVFAAGDRRQGLVQAESFGHHVVATLVAFAAFCLASSAVYLLNDVLDVEKDRAHPVKRRRPIASGALAVPTALGASAGLLIASLVLAAGWGGGRRTALLIGAYVALNVAYCLALKRVALVDAFSIASGFLLRLAAGGAAAGAEVSRWAFLCTLFLALFLALNKRRAELLALGPDVAATRASLRHYDRPFLDQLVAVMAACTIVAYTMYTLDPDTVAKFEHGRRLFWSVPCVVFGLGRYMVLVHGGRGGENPARVLLGGDGWFVANLVLWGALVGLAIT
jgi:4-hydroxybenzoate polyprenyltransferase